MAQRVDIPDNPRHTELVHFTEPMETFNDFVDLQAEVFDWQDDMLIPADDDYESELHFQQFINSNTDYWELLCLKHC